VVAKSNADLGAAGTVARCGLFVESPGKVGVDPCVDVLALLGFRSHEPRVRLGLAASCNAKTGGPWLTRADWAVVLRSGRRPAFWAALGGLAVAGAVLAGATPAAVRRAAQSVVIVRAESQGGHPYAAWQMASGWCANVVELAKNPSVGSDGSFFAENILDAGVLQPGQTTWLSSSPSTRSPSSYYVHVQAYACDFSAGPEWSPVVKFDVTPPPPPPPAPPPPPPTPLKVTFALRADLGGDTLTKVYRVHRGESVQILATASPRVGSAFDDFELYGRVCVALVKGSSCWASQLYITIASVRVLPKMVVRGRFTVFATLHGKVVGRASFPARL
jgi:hypothetical protein